jgi:transposase
MRPELAIVADMTSYDISQLPAPVQDYIRALEAQVSALNERIQLVEEQFRLAQSKRFAPAARS